MSNGEAQIVAIDDSPASLAMLAHGVDGLLVSLTTFASPRQGLAYLQHHAADLVLLGDPLRDMDALALLADLRELEGHGDTAVIVVSSKDYDQDRDAAKREGASDYLVKPVPARAIRAAVSKYAAARSPAGR